MTSSAGSLTQVIGGDPDKDIAVLQLLAPEEKLAELKPISIGTSTNLQVGQKVQLPRVIDCSGLCSPAPALCRHGLPSLHVDSAGPSHTTVPTTEEARTALRLMRHAMQVYAIGNPFGLDHTLTQVQTLCCCVSVCSNNCITCRDSHIQQLAGHLLMYSL